MGQGRAVTPQRAPTRSQFICRRCHRARIGLRAWMLTRGREAPAAITGDPRPHSAMRSDRSQRTEPAFDLPRGSVRLTVLLPNGSEPGWHELELRGPDGVRASREATLQDFITRLSLDVDLRSAPRGSYQLAIRRTGEDWQLFPTCIQTAASSPPFDRRGGSCHRALAIHHRLYPSEGAVTAVPTL